MANINVAFIDAFNNGMVKLNEQALIPETHWYPCGFAWLVIKVRKNDKVSHTLKSLGFRWSDYNKQYQFSMPCEAYKAAGMQQSMDYATRCLTALANVLNDAGYPCFVQSRID